MESLPQIATPPAVRCLLRKLRDLNLSARGIAVNGGGRVSIEGCLSLDAPVESGVRYRVVVHDGAVLTLEIGWRAGKLELDPRAERGAVGPRALRVDLVTAEDGRTVSRALGARIAPETAGPRALERFLRRVVRAIFA
jgi:hypothetical protein